jgi:hypothetical protein
MCAYIFAFSSIILKIFTYIKLRGVLFEQLNFRQLIEQLKYKMQYDIDTNINANKKLLKKKLKEPCIKSLSINNCQKSLI